jgi:hypothetical protein
LTEGEQRGTPERAQGDANAPDARTTTRVANRKIERRSVIPMRDLEDARLRLAEFWARHLIYPSVSQARTLLRLSSKATTHLWLKRMAELNMLTLLKAPGVGQTRIQWVKGCYSALKRRAEMGDTQASDYIRMMRAELGAAGAISTLHEEQKHDEHTD